MVVQGRNGLVWLRCRSKVFVFLGSRRQAVPFMLPFTNVGAPVGAGDFDPAPMLGSPELAPNLPQPALAEPGLPPDSSIYTALLPALEPQPEPVVLRTVDGRGLETAQRAASLASYG